MKSDVETLSPTRVKLTVDLPFEELTPHLDAAYKRIAAQVTVPGFRKGKVPSRVIDQRFGRALVIEEAVNEAVPAAFDISAACAGFCYGLAQAESLVRSGAAKYALVVGVEELSRFTDIHDRGTASK